MADPALKVVPEDTAPAPRGKRRRLRLILLVVLPLIAAAIGLGIYLSGGRYISTDNAYVGAQKVLITPDVSGNISRVAVREGQHVSPGDELLAIDPEPFQLARDQAESKLAEVRTQFATLKADYGALGRLIELADRTVALKQSDVTRKASLLSNHSGSQTAVDDATAALVAAQNQREQLARQRTDALNKLLGNPDLPIEKFPPFVQANAALEQARRNLDHTVIRAPIVGTATQVDNVQLGRFVGAGTPVLSVVDDQRPWVDANPKETDITYLRVGQKVTVDVDAFPGRTFQGVVASVSPGTGAQFAILPPQNASGNWVKVVQRVPVRITFDPQENTALLRAGMSATVSIDTGRSRSLLALLGLSATADDIQQ